MLYQKHNTNYCTIQKLIGLGGCRPLRDEKATPAIGLLDEINRRAVPPMVWDEMLAAMCAEEEAVDEEA